MQVSSSKKALREASLRKSAPVLEGINSQIKILRLMMLRIDDRSTRTAANRVSEMRSTIAYGSVYPLQNIERTSLFFCAR